MRIRKTCRLMQRNTIVKLRVSKIGTLPDDILDRCYLHVRCFIAVKLRLLYKP